MHVLAMAKRLAQTGKRPYMVFDPETKYTAAFDDLSEIDPQEVLQYMITHYTKDISRELVPKSYHSSVLNWTKAGDIVKHYARACQLQPKPLNVLDMDIWGSELKFSMPVTEGWAKYDFTHSGKHYAGQLRLEGSIDLIYNDPDMGYTILDWKSGAVDKAKTDDDVYADYCDDIQLKMYYLAARRYFRVPVGQMTICQVNIGKSFTVRHENEEEVLEEIRGIYEQMKAMEIPERKYTDNCVGRCPLIRQRCADYQSKPKMKTRTYMRPLDDGTVVETPMSACLQLHSYFRAGNSREHIENTLCRYGFDIDKYSNQ
jgi:hypothetical protein